MKKTIIIAALLLSTLFNSFAQSGKNIYQKYSEKENVQGVYISPAMFKLIGRIPDLEINDADVNLAPIIKSLSGLYIINSENPAINKDLKADIEQLIKSKRFELLMEAKDGSDIVRIYVVGNDKIVEGLVLLNDDGDEINFICIDGKMDRNDMEKLIAAAIAE